MNSSFYVLQDLILTLLGDDIVHKDTLFLHELLFCADKGFLLVLFDVDIIHMNIWYLHALLFYVFQDFLLKLVDADIDHKDTLFLHEQSKLIKEIFWNYQNWASSSQQSNISRRSHTPPKIHIYIEE